MIDIELLTLIFIMSLFAEVVALFAYVRRIRKLVEYAHRKGLTLFGRKYKTVYELYIDISFFNNLLSATQIQKEEDQLLRKNLISTRRLFIFQFINGLIFVVLIALIGAIT
ncbi:hypothetical protein T5B8_12158 [Salinisphaera sp. T5B8]|uniref:hypothetical protein n=1 Tax=Salinisphaera sp. T5B8 TaxID=1304154 RepID=UPI00334277D4